MLNINNIIKQGFIPYKYSFRATKDKKALCILQKGTEKFICVKSREKSQIFKDVIKEFKDENSYISIFKLNWDNYISLKKHISISPTKINKRVSFGVGDRTGLATASQLRAITKFDVFPILAQQTPEELRALNRTYKSCLLNSVMGVLQTGFVGDWGADANNISDPEDLAEAIKADYSMFTINIVPFLRKLPEEEPQIIINKLNETSKALIDKFNYFGNLYNISEDAFIYSAYQTEKGVETALNYYKEIKKNRDDFDFEIGFNKATETTTLSDLLFIMLYLKENNIKITSIAPKFEGHWIPGCEYQGNREKLFEQMKQFSEITDKHGDVRLSLHSSDKFSVYPSFKRLTDNNYHIKTSGTSWLRLLILVAIHQKDLFDKMYNLSVNKQRGKVPYYNKEHPELFINDPALCMLFHTSYDVILNELKDDIKNFFNAHEEEYYHLIMSHLAKHLSN
ncbi:MAG: hypothetical protein IJS60_11360 [Abditibacteriota bacterium]|nr:hypothetical protein [Abditibacteriota bacterium]